MNIDVVGGWNSDSSNLKDGILYEGKSEYGRKFTQSLANGKGIVCMIM